MRLADAAAPVFARHETFHPRYGWFRKAYRAAALDPGVFNRKDAPVVIGVGKNMVRSIRFWGLAAKLIVEDPKPKNRRSPGMVPTRIGHAVFGESGWDPYMEDPGTLWLLHWLLLAPPSRLPVWWLAFNEFTAVEFSDSDIDVFAAAQLESAAEWSIPHSSSRRKDVRALLRTYAPAAHSPRTGIDDILDCPLRELNLIGRSADGARYRFTLGPKPSLPPEIAVYAALDYISRTGAGGNTATLSRLAHEPGSPGRAFRLTEADLLETLAPALQPDGSLKIVTPAGASQLSWPNDPAEAAVDVLSSYYKAPPPPQNLRLRAGPDGDRPVDDDLLEELGAGRNPSEEFLDLQHAILAGGR